MFPLRHGALFVVFCAEPACFVKNVHLLLCIFAAAPPSRGAWIEIIVDHSRYTWYT